MGAIVMALRHWDDHEHEESSPSFPAHFAHVLPDVADGRFDNLPARLSTEPAERPKETSGPPELGALPEPMTCVKTSAKGTVMIAKHHRPKACEGLDRRTRPKTRGD